MKRRSLLLASLLVAFSLATSGQAPKLTFSSPAVAPSEPAVPVYAVAALQEVKPISWNDYNTQFGMPPYDPSWPVQEWADTNADPNLPYPIFLPVPNPNFNSADPNSPLWIMGMETIPGSRARVVNIPQSAALPPISQGGVGNQIPIPLRQLMANERFTHGIFGVYVVRTDLPNPSPWWY